MNIKKDFSLKNYNTFGVDIKSKYFAKIESIEQLKKVLEQYPNEKILILGDGSNTLLVDNWEGLTLKIGLKGKELIKEDDKTVEIKVASGENWDEFVRYTVKNNWSGVENLVFIPGTIGAAIAQNIGAYGQEVIDSLISIEAFDLTNFKLKTFLPKECGFKYRNSFFKNEWRDRYIIISGTFKLRKYENSEKGKKEYNRDLGEKRAYEGLKEELKEFAKEPYNIEDIMNAVIRQRKKKLPSLEEYGTCGCFFENPIITKNEYDALVEKIPDLPSYPLEKNLVKIPAGKLLDELGWKNKWKDNVGVFEKHALCVVTKGNASGKEVYDFIKEMTKDVKKRYDVTLIPEVNIIRNQKKLSGPIS